MNKARVPALCGAAGCGVVGAALLSEGAVPYLGTRATSTALPQGGAGAVLQIWGPGALDSPGTDTGACALQGARSVKPHHPASGSTATRATAHRVQYVSRF